MYYLRPPACQVVAWSGVSSRHSFQRAILHVWCETARIAGMLQAKFTGAALGIGGRVVAPKMWLSGRKQEM